MVLSEATYELGKIFANHITNEQLISKIYEELLQINSEK